MATLDEETMRREGDVSRLAAELLAAGRAKEAIAMYLQHGVAVPTQHAAVAAEILLERDRISLALNICRTAQISPDRSKLDAAIAREERRGIIHPEVYDFLLYDAARRAQRV